MISTNNLTKIFYSQTAVNQLSITIKEGEIYGFLGPNGSGKTTTIRMLLGLLPPTSGSFSISGKSIQYGDTEYKRYIGVVPEKHPRGMWDWMTAEEYLTLFCDLYSVSGAKEKIDASLERLQLHEHRNKKISQFSRGMLQKLSFARAMMHNPTILLLDEPISGLDPIGIRQIRDIILEENRKGKTIVVSSHLLTEIEKICARIGIIYNGNLVTENSTQEVIDSLLPDHVYHIELEQMDASLMSRIKSLPFVKEAIVDNHYVNISVEGNTDYRRELSTFFYEAGYPPLTIQRKSKSLEDAFITITSQNVTHIETGGVR